MKFTKVLLPLDIRKCPREIFHLTRGFVSDPAATLTLLHVIEPGRAAANGQAHHTLRSEAQYCLERLAEENLATHITTVLRVRSGVPAEQIIQEAEDAKTQLIILPTYKPSFWSRLISWPDSCRPVSLLAERLIREASCGVFLVEARTRFNCETAWTQLMKTAAGNRNGAAVIAPRATYKLELSDPQQSLQTARQNSVL